MNTIACFINKKKKKYKCMILGGDEVENQQPKTHQLVCAAAIDVIYSKEKW